MLHAPAIILSAGASKRMGSPKALIKIGDRTLLEDQVIRLKNAGVEKVYVVVGADTEEIKKNHKNLNVTWVNNERWQDGNFSSVLCGLKQTLTPPHLTSPQKGEELQPPLPTCERKPQPPLPTCERKPQPPLPSGERVGPVPSEVEGVRGVLLLPVDVVGVEPEVIRSIIEKGIGENKNIVPTHNGKGGHPVFLREKLITCILDEKTSNDRLDHILKNDKNTIWIEVKSDTILNNINTPAKLKNLLNN